MVIILKKQPNNICIKTKDCMFTGDEFLQFLNGDYTKIDPDYTTETHVAVIIDDEVEGRQITEMYLNEDGTTSPVTDAIKREFKILPPDEEPIYTKASEGVWIVDPALLYLRKIELVKELYELRKSKTTYFSFNINNKTYTQRWEDYDTTRMESCVKELTGTKNTINWRFSGADLTKTVALNLEELQRLLDTGNFNDLLHTVVQFVVFGTIVTMTSSSRFNLVNRYNSVTTNYKSKTYEELKVIYNSIDVSAFKI